MKNNPTPGDIARFESRETVFYDIREEQKRQYRIHGNSLVDYLMMYAVLMEELGEVAEALQIHYRMPGTKRTDKTELYTELIQVSAYAAKFAEQVLLDEGEPT